MATDATKLTGPRWVPLAAVGALCVGIGVLVGVTVRQVAPLSSYQPAASPPLAQGPPPARSAQIATAAPVSPRHVAPLPAAPSPAPSLAAPKFDIVRVAPDGSTVIAGRAAPGSSVIVRDGTREIGRAQANADGAWVLVPNGPLAVGTHNLSVAAVPVQGGAEHPGAGSVVVAVTEGKGEAHNALAVLTGPEAPKVLQGAGAAHPGQLGIEALDYDQHGQARVSGTAPAGAHLRLYADSHLLGEAVAGADGRWTLAPSVPLSPGQHRLRLDQLGANGKVAKRLELPFARENFASRALPPGSIQVQPGQSLWRIAEARYGSGLRYTLIFGANRAQIRDPNRIYPGQVLDVPAWKEQAKRLEAAASGAR
jgi:hypothetical protein